MDDIRKKARQIRLLISDVDGVLTDGSLFFDNQGQEYKAFNARDGHGIRMLQDQGVAFALLTGRQSQLVSHRAENLKIPPELVYQGYRDKRPAFEALLVQTGLQAQQVAYIGDDVVDLPVMKRVGLALCVADAHGFVKQHADWSSQYPGGKGAVREACELLLDAQGKLQALLADYLA